MQYNGNIDWILNIDFCIVATQKMIINVLDENDNSPEFPQPKQYYFEIPEVGSISIVYLCYLLSTSIRIV